MLLPNHAFMTLAAVAFCSLVGFSDQTSGEEPAHAIAIVDIEKVMDEQEEANPKLKPIQKKARGLREQMKEGDPKPEELKELEQEMAEIKYDRYKRISEVVSDLAQKHNINFVSNFSSRKVNRSNLKQVNSRIKEQVVFHKQLDLTNMVLATLKQKRVSSEIGHSDSLLEPGELIMEGVVEKVLERDGKAKLAF